MTVNKRKKVTKYRALTTHGGGHRKKRRGAGNRGGRGRAGSGKRGKARKQSFDKLGKHGFSSIKTKKIKTINISSLDNLVRNKKIDITKVLDLGTLGYDKLLGAGKTNLKLQIKVKQFSKQAEEKIKSVGGSVVSAGKETNNEEVISKESEEQNVPPEE